MAFPKSSQCFAPYGFILNRGPPYLFSDILLACKEADVVIPGIKYEIRSHHPQGIKSDRLGYGTYAKVIAELLSKLETKHTGLTVGIFGDWGIGKSSALRMVREELDERNKNKAAPRKFLIVEFDAWRYAKQEELWLALFRRILTCIEQQDDFIFRDLLRLNFTLWKNRLDSNPRFWRNLLVLLLVAAGIAGVIAISVGLLVFVTTTSLGSALLLFAGGFSVFIAAWANATGSTLIDLLRGKINVVLPSLTRPGFDQGQSLLIDNFRGDFRTVVKTIGRTRPIIVLVDDLDRCPFDQVVPVLEAIKHFGFDDLDDTAFGTLGGARIAFVLAADRRAIELAVAGYYKEFLGPMKLDEASRFAREYVEKIVQVPFELPPLTREQLKKLLNANS